MKSRILLIAVLLFSLTIHAQTEVQIGSQIWSGENLSVVNFNNGDQIPHAATSEAWLQAAKSKTPAWCYYENKEENAGTYGVLYNWFAVTDPRGIAPEGWKIPTQKEVLKMIDVLGDKSASKMKSVKGWSGIKTNSNSSGFNGKPGGIRNFTSKFQDKTYTAAWWTATVVEPDYLNSAMNFHVKQNTDEIKVAGIAKNCGLYVRVLKK